MSNPENIHPEFDRFLGREDLTFWSDSPDRIAVDQDGCTYDRRTTDAVDQQSSPY